MNEATTKRVTGGVSHGYARWVGRSPNGDRLLEICPEGGVPKVYEVEVLDGGAGGWNLYYFKADWEVGVYRIRHVVGHPGAQACDCDSAVKGGRQYCCKHIKGLRAALKRLAQTEGL